MITPILVFIYDRKKKASPKRAGSVELRLTLERKSKYITTGVRLLPKEWHKGIVVNRPDSAELNELLDTIMVRARKVTHAMIEAGDLNLDEIPRRMEELTCDKRLFYDFCVERTKVRIYGKSKDTAAGLQIRIFTRKSLDDWKILLNFASLNIKKVKINNKIDI